MKKFFAQLTHIMPALALMAGVLSVNSACATFFYQAEPPKAMDQFRK